jgi:Carboxypeptidase regulatory-like domain
MRPRTACLMMALLSAAAAAQTSSAAKPASRAVIAGIVIKNPGSEPVKKAVIELIAENQSEGGDYTAVSAADGTFRIEGITPGRYHLFAERTGLLESGKRSNGRVLTLAAGQELTDLQIRLQAAAVVRGRVTDEDGEAMSDADVIVLRETFVAGRRRWEQVGSERTNDLGEYRIANLEAGNYYISVDPPPDFRSLIEAVGKSNAAASGPDRTVATSYQTTYYPGTTDRSQAAPIQLHAGDEFPVNFSLMPGPALSIRGSVVNLPPHSSAVIMLQSRDFNLLLNGAEVHPDGSFVIRDVAPGAYTILASVENAPVPMMARQSLQVVSGNVEGLRLAPQSGGWIRGRLRLESRTNAAADPSQLFLTLHPADGDDDALSLFVAGAGFNALTRIAADGSFEWKNVPPGNYYVQLAGDAGVDAGWFLKSVLADGRDITDSVFSVNGSAVGLTLVASANGGVVDGVVTDANGQPVANAVVVAVPEVRLRAHIGLYRKTVTDQAGRFILRGFAPGSYMVFAWENVDGESYYNPEFLKSYEPQGSALRVTEGEHKTLQLTVIPEAEEQP